MRNRSAIRITALITKPKHLTKISVFLGLLASHLNLLRFNWQGNGMIPLSIPLLKYLICSTAAQISEFGHNFLKNRLKNLTEALHYVQKMSFPAWTERCSHDKILQYKRNTESKETFLITTLQYHSLLPSKPSTLSVLWLMFFYREMEEERRQNKNM